MTNPTKYLALAFCSMTLAACGGGGGGGTGVDANVTATEVFWPVVPDANNSLASTALAKYEGEWRQACVDHMELKTVLVATSATTFTVTVREDYYAYADCTGAVVATGSYGMPSETVTYVETPVNASVTLRDGSLIQPVPAVNVASSLIATAPFTITGSGVQPTIYVDGKTMTPIQFTDAYKLYPARALAGGTTKGALMLLNGDLLTLVYAASDSPAFNADYPGTSFAVKLQFFR